MIKFCPDLTGREEVKAMLVGGRDFVRPVLHQCIQENCTAYDVDAVCEELEKLKNADIDMSDEELAQMDAEEIYDEGRAQGRVEAYVKAIEIVRNGGKNSD